jgi:hypothetical protein
MSGKCGFSEFADLQTFSILSGNALEGHRARYVSLPKTSSDSSLTAELGPRKFASRSVICNWMERFLTAEVLSAGESRAVVPTMFLDSTSRNIAVGSDGNLGTQLLQDFITTIDYSRKRLLLCRPQGSSEPN